MIVGNKLLSPKEEIQHWTKIREDLLKEMIESGVFRLTKEKRAIAEYGKYRIKYLKKQHIMENIAEKLHSAGSDKQYNYWDQRHKKERAEMKNIRKQLMKWRISSNLYKIFPYGCIC